MDRAQKDQYAVVGEGLNIASCLIAITLAIIPASSAARTAKEGCSALAAIGLQLAQMRDQGMAADQARAQLAATGMPNLKVNQMVGSVYEDMSTFAPDAVEYVLFTFCLEDPKTYLK